MKSFRKVFAVYLSDSAVELRENKSDYLGGGRFICSQSNYKSLLKFATNLAIKRHLPLQNHITFETQYEYWENHATSAKLAVMSPHAARSQVVLVRRHV